MKSKSTLEDVARLAKVSPATVSRVVNRTSRVSPAVEKRIRIAAEELGFDLRKKNRTRLIAFVLSNRSLLYPFHTQVLLASQASCAAQDYNLLFFPLDYSEQQQWEKLHVPPLFYRSDLLDGFIVSGVNHQNLLDLLSNTGLPFVVLGDTVQGDWRAAEYDVVKIDDTEGAFETTRYLISLGHTQIVYIANAQLVWFARRMNGYRRAMEQAGLEPYLSHIDSENEHEVGFLGTKALLAQRKGPVHAIFAGSDAIAYGVYSALREAGLRVPDDVSVCGFNDTPDASLLYPPLTSVNVFPDLIGRSLGELLMARIANPALPPQEHLIHTKLVKRESCLRSFDVSHTPRQE